MYQTIISDVHKNRERERERERERSRGTSVCIKPSSVLYINTERERGEPEDQCLYQTIISDVHKNREREREREREPGDQLSLIHI